MKVAVCKNNIEHTRFRAQATVREEWIVDRQGNYKERANDERQSEEVVEEPHPSRDEFWCAVCDDYEPTLIMDEGEFEEKLQAHTAVSGAISRFVSAMSANEGCADDIVEGMRQCASLSTAEIKTLIDAIVEARRHLHRTMIR
jgi:hypothetical protein